MATTIAVKVPDNTGGHFELFQSQTTDLGLALNTPGAIVYMWGMLPDGTFGPNTQPLTITKNFANTGGYLLNGCPINVLFGEGWLPGQQELLQQYGVTCVPPAPSTAQYTIPPSSSAVINPGTTTQGGVTSINFANSPITAVQQAYTNSAVAAAIQPSITPGLPGSTPDGTAVGQTGGSTLTVIYRFILNSAPNRYDTGANYPGCSQTNSAMCDPQQFTSLQDALDYASSRDEVPYIVHSASEVWGIIAGTIPLNPKNIYGTSSDIPWLWVAVGVGAILFLRKTK